MNTNEFLAHYGIPGMRWGKRRAKADAKLSKKKVSDDYQKTKGLRKKNMNSLSNSELKELTTRLQLEKQYKDLKKSSNKGEKFVSDVIAASAKQNATSYVSKYMGKGIEAVIKTAFVASKK